MISEQDNATITLLIKGDVKRKMKYAIILSVIAIVLAIWAYVSDPRMPLYLLIGYIVFVVLVLLKFRSDTNKKAKDVLQNLQKQL